MNTTTSQSNPPAPAPARKRTRAKASECLPVYGAGMGLLSFRNGLTVTERKTIDKALAIVGRSFTTERAALDSPDAVKSYVQLQIGGEPVEHFCVLFLDMQNRFLCFQTLFVGTISQTSVYPREVVALALRLGASAVILAHNHPSGAVTPSRADESLTHTLKSALALVDVRVLDHVIVSGSGTLSMAEKGLV